MGWVCRRLDGPQSPCDVVAVRCKPECWLAFIGTAMFCVFQAARAEAETPARPLGSIPEKLEEGDTPQETWALNTLDLVETRDTRATLIGIPIVRVDSWLPVVGKYRYGLSRSEFFERAGRPDLAARQSARDTTSDVLFWSGALLSLGGVALPFILQGDNVDTTGVLLGAGVFVGGVILNNVGAAMSGPVVDEAQAAALARRYNDALERRVLSHTLRGPLDAPFASEGRAYPSISYVFRF